MTSSAESNSFLGSLFQIKLTDDVTNLLSTPANITQQKFLQNNFKQQQQQQPSQLQVQQLNFNNSNTSTPSTSRLSTNSTLSATSNDTVTTSFSTSIDLRHLASKKFEEQIKYLDKQAKGLQMQINNNNGKINDLSMLTPLSTPTQTPMLPTTSPPPLPSSMTQQVSGLFENNNNKSILSNMRNPVDIKDEEKFYEKIKERLNMQIEETEKLKHNLMKSREKSVIHKVAFSLDNTQRTNSVPNLFEDKDTSSHLSSVSSRDLSYKATTTSDEVLLLRNQLKEANLTIEELKLNFRKNLIDLQTKLQECVEEKDRMQMKKEKRIKDLIEENQSLKEDMENLKKNSLVSSKNDKLNNESVKKVAAYEVAFKKFIEIINLEEKKREKSYFTDNEVNNDDPEYVFQAIQKCLDDYHGEIKHIKSTIKDSENSIEEKMKALKDKEITLEQEYNKKHKTMKDDFDKLVSEKTLHIESKQNEISELKANLFNLKSKYETDLHSKELAIADLRIKNDEQINNLNLIIESYKTQNEQFKLEIELNKKNESNIMQKYHEQLNTNNFYLKENETFKNNYQNLQNSFDAFKTQSKNFESLIEDLNNQIGSLRRERNELLTQIENLNKKLENEKLENSINLSEIKKLKDEKQLTGIVLSKFKKMDENFNDLLHDQEKLQNLLDLKSKELSETSKLKETIEANLKLNEEKMRTLNEEKINLELRYKEQSIKLSNLQLEVDGYSTMMHQNSKNSALLKDEKETLNRILHDNAAKLKEIKNEYDNVVSKLDIKEKLYSDLQIDYDVTCKKLEQIQTLNDALIKDKEELLKELKESRFEVNNLQTNCKALNKKLMQTITDKDTQISQTQQSLMLLEREINLLKQAERLHKNQEDSKVAEVASTIQNKLSQKRQKIELLKAKIIALEANLEAVKKEKNELQEEKSHLESQLITYQSKNEALQQELKNTEYNLQETRKKISRYEMALEKAAIKYSNLQIMNETLEKELNKFKQIFEQYNIQKHHHIQLQQQHQQYQFQQKQPLPQQQQQQLQTYSAQQLNTPVNNNNNLQIQLKEPLEPVIAPQTNTGDNSQNLRFTNELKNILQEMKFVLFKCNNQTNQNAEKSNGRENLLDSVDEKSINEESQASFQETTKQICNRLETKLNKLNQMGLNLKKENDEVIQILQNGMTKNHS